MCGNIVGYRTVNYVNKDNVPVSGINLYLTYEDVEVFGRNIKEIFIGSDRPLFQQFKKYLTGDADKLVNAPAEWDFTVETRGGKTFARLANFKILEVIPDGKH